MSGIDGKPGSVRFILGILWMNLLLLAACAGGNFVAPPGLPGSDTSPPLLSPFTPEATTFAWADVARPYQGVVLRGISENSPPSLYIQEVLAPAFTAETGIQVELEIDTLPAIEQAIAAGGDRYDFVYMEQDSIYSFLEDGYLTNLTQLMADQAHLVVPLFNLRDFTNFINEFRDPATGDLYGVPIEAFIKVYLYRKDLFEDPVIRAAFETEYRYPLAPAVTFQQYQDIADFFTRYGQARQLPLWGTTVQAAVGDIAPFYEFFETIAPAFGIYNWGINLETYRATEAHGGRLDSQQAKDALAFWVGLLDDAPPEARHSNWKDVFETFAAGRAAQGWVYGEYVAALATDPARSRVVGKVGVALPPTAAGVIEDATVGMGNIGYYDGAAFGIPVASRHKEAALLWFQYLGQPAIQPQWAVASGRVVHLSTFDDPLVQEQNRHMDGYYSLMKKYGHLFKGSPPFPFHARLRDIIAPYLHKAITGELSPGAALEQAAQAADAELIRLGYPR